MGDSPVEKAPRWDVIDKWYGKIDTIIDDMIEEDETPVIELSILFMLLQEKLNQQKTGLYIEYLKEQTSNKKADDLGLYR